METLELVLLLFAAVLASSVVSQFLSKVPTSLVQIGMGLLIALFAAGQVHITLDPELFLVLFIAPLLYDEARSVNLGDLWHFRWPVLIYAIGLVVTIVLAVGFSLKALMPGMPLAAAFALGAALGPTDAVAVAAVSKQTAVSKRNLSILKGEALLNDASGLVSFQFAVAAVVTGGFSLFEASVEFVIMFVGGIVLGALLGLIINYCVEKIRNMGLQDTTFHVLLELFIPFIVFLLAESVHVSGIIAVVVTGVVNAATPRTSDAVFSRTSIVSTSVWKVVAFTLNGIVFILLGTQLPSAMLSTWESYAIPNEWLVLLVLAITFSLEAIRFLYSMAVEWHYARKEKRKLTKADVLSALTLTLSGAKGTITLSIMLTLPFMLGGDVSSAPFPYRDLLIFLACGTIVLTLLLATFVVPLIAPKKVRKESDVLQHEADVEAMIDILREVIEYLNESVTRDNAKAVASVSAAYNARISRIKDAHDIGDDKKVSELELRCLAWEKEFVIKQMNLEQVDPMIGYDVLAQLNRREDVVHDEGAWASVSKYFARVVAVVRVALRRVQHKLPFTEPSDRANALRSLKADSYHYVIHRLQQDMASMDDNSEDVSSLLIKYQRMRDQLRLTGPSITAMAKNVDKGDEVELKALRYELKLIQEAVDNETISRAYAKRAKENVYLMQIDLENRV